MPGKNVKHPLTPQQRSDRTRKGWLKRKRAVKKDKSSLRHPLEIPGKPVSSKIPTRLRRTQILKARRKLGEALSAKIRRRSAGHGREIALTFDEVDRLLQDGIVGFISAGRNPNNEDDKQLSDEQVAARYKKLKADLIDAGYSFVSVVGKYGEVEDSFMVMAPEADKEHLLSLGRKYHQDSVLYSVANSNELVYTTGPNAGLVHAGDGFERVDDAQDFYTMYCDRAQHCMKFTLGLSFDKLRKQRLSFSVGLPKGYRFGVLGKTYTKKTIDKVAAIAHEVYLLDPDTGELVGVATRTEGGWAVVE